MRIATRVKLIPTICVVMMAMISTTALLKLSNAEKAIGDLADNQIPSIIAINKIQKAFGDVRSDLMSHILATTDASSQTAEQALADDTKTLTAAVAAYEPFISDAQDKQQWQDDSARINSYLTASTRVLELSRQGRDDEARAINTNTLGPLATQVSDALNAHSQLNETSAEQQHEQTQAEHSRAIWELALMAGGSTLVLAWLAFVLYRTTVVPVMAARDVVRTLESRLDFNLRATVQTDDEIGELLQAFNSLVARLQGSLRDISGGVGGLDQAVHQVASAAVRVSDSSSHQSTAASTIAAAVEEITVSIGHVAARAGEASTLAAEASQMARKGDETMGRSTTEITGIAQSVEDVANDIRQLEARGKEIASVIGVIRAVAEQTNLLALNAAIEAARAGEQGRGFAVVADEVRSLAERTAGSTQEIAGMVQAIQDGADKAVARVDATVARVRQGVQDSMAAHEAMKAIRRASEEGGQAIGEIAHAMKEQSEASNSMSAQVEQIARMADDNARSAEANTAVAAELGTLMQQMQAAVNSYKV